MSKAASLNLQQAQLLVTGLHEVARVDGVTPAEDVMIRQFYEACRSETDALADYDNLSRAVFDPEATAAAFNTPESRALFISTCVFLGYADGHFTAPERIRLGEIAVALGVSAAEYAAIAETVHDQLIGQFAHVQNVEALQAVSQETRPG